MAADSVIFLGWNRPVAGREKTAVELFGTSMAYFNELKSSGQIESFEPVLLHAHGGDLNGFILIRGDEAKLDALVRSEKFMDLTTKIVINLDGFGVIRGWTGDALMKQFGRYTNFLG